MINWKALETAVWAKFNNRQTIGEKPSAARIAIKKTAWHMLCWIEDWAHKIHKECPRCPALESDCWVCKEMYAEIAQFKKDIKEIKN